MHRARYPGVALYRRLVSLLPVPHTIPLKCPLIQDSSLVFIAQSIPSPPQGSGTLDEAGDPQLWFRVAGRLSTGLPHREKETITASEICFLTATELVRLVRAKELSALEVMEAQIERVNPEVNAIVTLTAEQAMDRARATDDAIARDEEVGLLCGLSVDPRVTAVLENQRCSRYRDDFGVLQLAHAFEEAAHHGERRPPLAG
jgi:Amidase